MNYAGSTLFVLLVFSTALTGHYWKELSLRVRGTSSWLCSEPYVSAVSGTRAVYQKQVMMEHGYVHAAQNEGRRETALAATYILASPWALEECPLVRLPPGVQLRWKPKQHLSVFVLTECHFFAGRERNGRPSKARCVSSRLPGTESGGHKARCGATSLSVHPTPAVFLCERALCARVHQGSGCAGEDTSLTFWAAPHGTAKFAARTTCRATSASSSGMVLCAPSSCRRAPPQL
jgi:hypothetical protein